MLNNNAKTMQEIEKSSIFAIANLGFIDIQEI